MKNLVSFRLDYKQPGIASTTMIKTPVANLARTDINGKPLGFEDAGNYGKNTSEGVSFSTNGDHAIQFSGDLYDAQAYLPELREWNVSQESTVRVRDYAPLHYVASKDRDYIVGSNRVGKSLSLEGGSFVGYQSAQWMRNGVDINGATKYKYKQTADDIGKTISVRVTNKRGYLWDGLGNEKTRLLCPRQRDLHGPRNRPSVSWTSRRRPPCRAPAR